MSQVGSVFNAPLPEGCSKKETYSSLIKLIWPAAVEYALLQLVGIFDQIQISGLGEYAISGVGLANTVKLIFVTVFMAVNFGVTTIVAGAVGRKDQEKIPFGFVNGAFLTLIMAVPGTILVFLFSKPILTLFKAPDPISLSLANEYFRICVFGFVPLSLTTTCTAALRGVSDAKTPLFYNMVANIINVFLNWVLINGKLGFPRLEVRGAAIATIIAQYVAFIIAIVSCVRPKNKLGFRISGSRKAISKAYISDLIRIGGPSMYEQLIARLGLSFYTMVVATLGTSLYATHTLCMNIQSLTIIGGMALSLATTTTTGVSLGKRNQPLAEFYTSCCIRISLIISLVMMVVYGVLGSSILRIYTPVESIISQGTKLLRIVAFMQPFATVLYVYTGTLRGSGDAASVAKIATISTFGCRPLIAFLLVRVLGLGLKGAWYALFFDQVLYSTLLMLRYRSGKWVQVFEKMKVNK